MDYHGLGLTAGVLQEVEEDRSGVLPSSLRKLMKSDRRMSMQQKQINRGLLQLAKKEDAPTKFTHTLVERGATASIRDDEGNTPLHYSVQRGAMEMTEFLLETLDASPNLLNKEGHTAFHTALLEGSLDMVRLLVEYGGEVDTARPSDGATPLHLSAYRNSPAICQLLLESGADAGAMSENQQTALEYALERGSSGCIRHLKQAVNEINAELRERRDREIQRLKERAARIEARKDKRAEQNRARFLEFKENGAFSFEETWDGEEDDDASDGAVGTAREDTCQSTSFSLADTWEA